MGRKRPVPRPLRTTPVTGRNLMRKKFIRPRWAFPLALVAVAMLALASVAVAHDRGSHDPHGHGHGSGHGHESGEGTAAHVLLLSVDGLHESDLRWYVGKHPHSALAS